MEGPTWAVTPPNIVSGTLFHPASSSSSTTLPLKNRIAVNGEQQQQHPAPSEGTIFTIYSMYSDAEDQRRPSSSTSVDNQSASLCAGKHVRQKVYEAGKPVNWSRPSGSQIDLTTRSNEDIHRADSNSPYLSQTNLTAAASSSSVSVPEIKEPFFTPPESLNNSRANLAQQTPSPQPKPTSQLLSPHPRLAVNGNPVHFPSPPSSTSLVPSEGEAPDSFFVRETYARLDTTGVVGDGFDEGVERTRARMTSSKSKDRRQEASIVPTANEKSRDLKPAEVATLESLDRYGFFVMNNHERLILLPANPLRQRLKKRSRLPRNASTSPTALKSQPRCGVPATELERIAKWGRMLHPIKPDPGSNTDHWSINGVSEAIIRRRVYKGVPDRWRATVWSVFLQQISSNPENLPQLADEYRAKLDQASEYDVQIDLDVPRTISGHILFRTRYGLGQRSLFHVLHSFSLRCPRCGYVQGMGPIAATLLCYYTPERVYATLVRLHDEYKLHELFSPGFPGLLEAIYVQEQITLRLMPTVYAAFKEQMISTTSYATKWYITLFANTVPFQTQLRLWDVFLFEGSDLFIAVAIAIVWAYKEKICSSSANFETVLSLLSSFFVPENDDVFLDWIEKMLKDTKLRKEMTRWRLEWRDLVANGKDAGVLL